MSANLKLLDSFKLTGRLITNFACTLSQDDRIFIISDQGLYIVTQKPNLTSVFPEYMCHKYFFKPSTYAICENVDIDINNFVYELPKDILFESAACVELTQNLNGATPSTPTVLCAQWSDANMVDNVYSMLGLLTSLHSLEIYIKSVSESNLVEYKMIANLTSQILDRRKGEFIYSNRLPPIQKMRELKKRVEYIAPTTFEWSHTFPYQGGNKCAIVFIGHFHGDISMWRIFSVESSDNNTRCDFLCRYSSKMGNITALYWHRTMDYGGALCIGDCDGKISVLQISNLEKLEECFVNNQVEFCSQKDRKVDKITVMTFGQYTLLIAIKQSYLLVYGIDLSGRVIDFTLHNVHNFYITGISHKNNIMKVLTFTGAFKELKISIHFNKIVIDETTIPLKFDFSGHRTHGLIESSNSILFAIITSPHLLKNSIRGKRFITFSLFNDVNISPLKLLLENDSGSLRTFWDCFEALRLICLKEQRFPWLGLNANLDLDSFSLLQLKTLRLIAKLSESVFAVIKRVVSYEIKPYILLHYLVDIKLITQRLAKLFHDKNAEGKTLSLFELRSIDLQVVFLKELVVSGILPKAQVGSTFIKEISHILAIANELKYPDMMHCHFCGEKLIGPTCLPPHADSRCAFTMMPILSAAYRCVLCQSLAHNEVDQELSPVVCPYCDYPMEKVICCNDFEKALISVDNNVCLSDCLRDSEEALQELNLNLEDNEIVLVHVSDDEDDKEGVANNNDLKKLYFKLSNVKLDDISVNTVGSSKK